MSNLLVLSVHGVRTAVEEDKQMGHRCDGEWHVPQRTVEKPEACGWGDAMLIGKHQTVCLWEEDLEMLGSNWMGATGTQWSLSNCFLDYVS